MRYVSTRGGMPSSPFCDVLLEKDAHCANWIKVYREPAPEGAQADARAERDARRRRRGAA